MKIFNFPPYDYADLGCYELLKKLKEEVDEVEQAIYNYEDSNHSQKMRLNMMEELADVIHCAETIMRYYGANNEEFSDAAQFVTLKNKLRGYYGFRYGTSE